uniref:Uncharacterized protein n=1 Tax=Arundo donax TaxID=35708 RepID=A0A0A9AGH4_ARUDO
MALLHQRHHLVADPENTRQAMAINKHRARQRNSVAFAKSFVEPVNDDQLHTLDYGELFPGRRSNRTHIMCILRFRWQFMKLSFRRYPI